MEIKMREDTKRLLIVDGNNCVCRAYFAIRMLTDSFGRPCNAVYGFAKMLLHLIEVYIPSHIIVFFDSQSKRRKELYPEYKANRKKEGLEDLHSQMPIALELVRQFGLQTVRVEGYEADDLVAAIAEKALQSKLDTLIHSTDKDMCQLVVDQPELMSTSVKILRPSAKGDVIFGSKEVKEKFGVYPHQIALYLALVGDTSDNIPGVKGIGEKTAAKIINEYIVQGEKIRLSNSAPQKIHDKLMDNKDIFKLSYDLAKLTPDKDLFPLLPEIDQLEFNGFPAEARMFVQQLGFTSLEGKL